MANVRNDTISIDFDHFVHIELFLPRYKTEYHLVFIPLHRLHLFRSIGLFIGVWRWSPILFFLCIVQKPLTNGAYRLYEQCLAEVSTVLTVADVPCYFLRWRFTPYDRWTGRLTGKGEDGEGGKNWLNERLIVVWRRGSLPIAWCFTAGCITIDCRLHITNKRLWFFFFFERCINPASIISDRKK